MIRVPPQPEEPSKQSASGAAKNAGPGGPVDGQMEAVGNLVGNIAHDFNNVLTLIKSYCHLAQMDVDEGQSVAQSLERIVAASDRGVILTRQLMLMTPQFGGEGSEVDINGVILEHQGLLRRLFEPRIKVHLNLGASLAPLHGNAGLLGQFILDLALNAAPWASAQGDVLLETGMGQDEEGMRRVLVALRLTRCVESEEENPPLFRPILTEYLGLSPDSKVLVEGLSDGECRAEIRVSRQPEGVIRYELEIPLRLHS